MTVVVVGCLASAVALLLPGLPAPPGQAPPAEAGVAAGDAWVRRWRPVSALLAGAAAAALLPMSLAVVVAPAAAVIAWVVLSRLESPAARREREAARRELPHVVGLLADALRGGQSPVEAVGLVVRALPGPASDRLAVVVPRLRLGVDPRTAWAGLECDPALGPLARVLARAESTGAPVVPAVERLAVALAEGARSEVEDRARAVGVRAAIPLGLCLLPSFVLLGVVPVVAGMLGNLSM